MRTNYWMNNVEETDEALRSGIAVSVLDNLKENESLELSRDDLGDIEDWFTYLLIERTRMGDSDDVASLLAIVKKIQYKLNRSEPIISMSLIDGKPEFVEDRIELEDEF